MPNWPFPDSNVIWHPYVGYMVTPYGYHPEIDAVCTRPPIWLTHGSPIWDLYGIHLDSIWTLLSDYIWYIYIVHVSSAYAFHVDSWCQIGTQPRSPIWDLYGIHLIWTLLYALHMVYIHRPCVIYIYAFHIMKAWFININKPTSSHKHHF